MQLIGVDIGGTWIRAAVVGRDGEIGRVMRVPTARERSPDDIVTDIAALISREVALTDGEVPAVGVGVPTTVDAQGSLDPCPNLPTMPAYPLARELSRRLGCPVFTENDANCFALGEWRFGAGKGALLLAGLTLGTGIGLGIVANGRLLRGAHGRAGEIWRSPADLAQSVASSQNIEAWVSGSALEGRYEATTGVHRTGKDIADLAERGDAAALLAFEAFGEALGNVMLWISDFLDPDVIVIGGSAAASFHFYGNLAVRPLEGRSVRVQTSYLGDRAAIHGAALLALCRLEGREI